MLLLKLLQLLGAVAGASCEALSLYVQLACDSAGKTGVLSEQQQHSNTTSHEANAGNLHTYTNAIVFKFVFTAPKSVDGQPANCSSPDRWPKAQRRHVHLLYIQIILKLVFEAAYVRVKARPPQAAKEAPSRGHQDRDRIHAVLC
jgi:hypothetical protein